MAAFDSCGGLGFSFHPSIDRLHPSDRQVHRSCYHLHLHPTDERQLPGD
jgi:hypothetical protein